MLQTETATERFDDGLYELERAVQAEIDRRAKAEEVAKTEPDDTSGTDTTPPMPAAQPERPVAKPKPVVEVNVSSVYNKTCEGAYMETQESIDQFVEALRAELQAIIQAEKRARLR